MALNLPSVLWGDVRLGNVLFALTIIGWVGYARLVRAQVLAVKEKEFVEAARALGATLRRVHEEFEEFRTAAGLPRKRMIVSYMDRDLDPESAPESDAGPNRLFRGHASFHAGEPHEVLSLEEAGELLQVGNEDIEALAEAGELPGRKIGSSWRFSRTALLAWLRNDAA
jgi:excisionase family DNA binding protein